MGWNKLPPRRYCNEQFALTFEVAHLHILRRRPEGDGFIHFYTLSLFQPISATEKIAVLANERQRVVRIKCAEKHTFIVISRSIEIRPRAVFTSNRLFIAPASFSRKRNFSESSQDNFSALEFENKKQKETLKSTKLENKN
jgi:hypothetical protein